LRLLVVSEQAKINKFHVTVIFCCHNRSHLFAGVCSFPRTLPKSLSPPGFSVNHAHQVRDRGGGKDPTEIPPHGRAPRGRWTVVPNKALSLSLSLSQSVESVLSYYSVKRDLLQCQTRPITVSKETYYSVESVLSTHIKRNLLHCQNRHRLDAHQKRPMPVSKERREHRFSLSPARARAPLARPLAICLGLF
jgi:hypothetical protein